MPIQSNKNLDIIQSNKNLYMIVRNLVISYLGSKSTVIIYELGLQTIVNELDFILVSHISGLVPN